jgi:hypothetical protein
LAYPRRYAAVTQIEGAQIQEASMGAISMDLVGGSITWATGSILCFAGLACGAIGGAIGGVLVGGKHVGYGLSALMGMFFGPIAALPGVLIALLALSLSS